MTYKVFYRRFLDSNQGVQHFACHSHHYWPDVTRDAMLQYWDDTATRVDDKWDYFFSEKVPELQNHIAKTLNTGQPDQLVFAPNTHELLFRVISCLDLSKPQTIVTTDSEFHSFNRQVDRLNELSNIEVVKVATLPIDGFQERMIEAIQRHNPDLLFFSQVFFNSGLVVPDLASIIESHSNTDSIIVVDGYHGFMAVPTDLSQLADRIFYLAGGYKYAQGGEGGCFMHVPKSGLKRPLYTGWFAEFGALADDKPEHVVYSDSGWHFAGSTMDLSPLYRMLASLQLFEKEGLTVPVIHEYVQSLQKAFLNHLANLSQNWLSEDVLLVNDLQYHGHFLTFKLRDSSLVKKLHDHLKHSGVVTDARGDRLRFGFALYHDASDYDLSGLESFSE